MNTWMTEVIYGANERFFSKDELERLSAYYGTLPARLRAAEDLKRQEQTLFEPCRAEIRALDPDGVPLSEILLRDQIESMRLVAQAMLLDDARLLQSRLLDHLVGLTRNLAGADRELHSGYQAVQNVLRRQLSPSSFVLLEPFLDRILETLTDAAVASAPEGKNRP